VPAPRLTDLQGVRIALSDNTKKNADRLLSAIGRRLADRYGCTVESSTRPHDARLDSYLEELAAKCGASIHGVGD
jgi:hypothetical protein